MKTDVDRSAKQFLTESQGDLIENNATWLEECRGNKQITDYCS